MRLRDEITALEATLPAVVLHLPPTGICKPAQSVCSNETYVTAPMRMSVCRPSVGKYVGGRSEAASGSGDRGRSLGLVCVVGRGGTVHGRYVTILNRLGKRSMGK